jgi:membrane associated rhomboid family serine protease
MERKYAYFIVLRLVIGAVFGVSFGAAQENIPLGVQAFLGALGGVFVGWFAAAAMQKRNETKKE